MDGRTIFCLERYQLNMEIALEHERFHKRNVGGTLRKWQSDEQKEHLYLWNVSLFGNWHTRSYIPWTRKMKLGSTLTYLFGSPCHRITTPRDISVYPSGFGLTAEPDAGRRNIWLCGRRWADHKGVSWTRIDWSISSSWERVKVSSLFVSLD